MYYITEEYGAEKGESVRYTIFTNRSEMLRAMEDSSYLHLDVTELETPEAVGAWFAEGVFLPICP